MIFLTVGSQIPFDRLVRAVDAWCANSPHTKVFGQIAELGKDGYRPQNFPWSEFLSPEEFSQRFIDAGLIVGHAGMGTIISALTYQRPLLVLSRRVAYSETRNDHQVATARHFADRNGICVASDETELPIKLDAMINTSETGTHRKLEPFADPGLIAAARNGILGGSRL